MIEEMHLLLRYTLANYGRNSTSLCRQVFEITSKFDIKHAQKPITNISCITHVGLH